MQLKRLELFALVAELGSLSKAAAAADTTQPHVSRQIARLEAQWGDRLFERTGRGVALTDFGRRVEPEVRLLLAQARQLAAAVENVSGVPSGTVDLGVVPSVASRLLPRLLRDLREKAPRVRLRFTEDFTGTLEERLASGHLDMVVMNRYGEAPRTGEDVLGFVDTLLIGRPNDPRVKGQVVQFRQLAGLPLVLPPMPNGLRTFLDRQARQYGFKIQVELEVNNLATMMNVAASGEAFTLAPEIALGGPASAGPVGAWRLRNPGIRRSISLKLSTHHPLSSAARLVALRVRALTSELLSNRSARASATSVEQGRAGAKAD
ncbi:MAG: LysR family transcriptional regulator [Limnobacter sp.]|nr:LysR family transcriptional regulator [Limnobacter sp.]